ncbi:hypothetical protein CapIbe_013568, partial [Capra ibex]
MARETGVDRCSLLVLRVKQFEIDSPEETGSSHALKDRPQLLSDKRRGRTSKQEGRTIQAGIEQQEACGSSQGSWPGHRTVVRDRAARVWGCNSSRVNDPRPGTQVRKRSKKGGPEVRLSWIPPQGPYLAGLRTSRGKGLELRSHLTWSKPGRCLLYTSLYLCAAQLPWNMWQHRGSGLGQEKWEGVMKGAAGKCWRENHILLDY